MRVGHGFDAHRFSPTGHVTLAGVVVDTSRGLEATSDGDVLAHAVGDALLGAVALGDLGELFPSGDPQWEGADSMRLLGTVVERLEGLGHRISSVDATVIAQSVRVAPHRETMRANLGAVLRLQTEAVSVKATTTDHMGFLGRDEGIAAVAIACVDHSA